MKEERRATPGMTNKHESARERWGKLLESPLLWGVIALVAIAVTFSPRVSAMASWFVLASAWLVATLITWNHNQPKVRGQRLLVTGAFSTFFAVVLVAFGFWLTRSKLATLEENRVLRSHLHILRFQPRFQPSPLTPGKMVALNVYFRNDGQVPAELEGFYKFFFAELSDDLAKRGILEDQFFQIMRNGIPAYSAAFDTIPIGTERWFTNFGPYLSAEQLGLMQTEKYVIYFVGTMRYRDSAGIHETNYCVSTYKPEIVLACLRHNEEP